MPGLSWTNDDQSSFDTIRDNLKLVSTASATQLLIKVGWRNTTMVGLRPLTKLGLGQRLVGRARTCRYLMRRAPEGLPDLAARRTSAEIELIETIDAGDVFLVDALGVPTAGIIGDILATRLLARGAVAAVIHGAVRDEPYLAQVGLPVFCATTHPSHSGRDLVAVDYDLPIDMAGVQVLPGDIILADDEAVVAMPLDLAEIIAASGPPKELLEEWIRAKIAAGGSVHDYYPPSPEKANEYTAETGRSVNAEPHAHTDSSH
jgi:5-oxopent-3-ene-1,2,5-tricarboxylate decarboxylase / 2-hydroxyhepta-2,4-diene-1,7-dioate isomerase